MRYRFRVLTSFLLLGAPPSIAWLLIDRTITRAGKLALTIPILAASTAVARWFFTISSPAEQGLKQIYERESSRGLRLRLRHPWIRLLVYLLHAALATSVLATILALIAPGTRHSLGLSNQSFGTLAHVVTALTLIYLVWFATVYWTKDHAKHAKLLEISQTLYRINGHRTPPPTFHGAVQPVQLVPSVHESLRTLLHSTNQDIQFARFLGRPTPTRTAWILLPEHAHARFRTVHISGFDECYRKVASDHRPALLNAAKVAELEGTRRHERANLRPEAYDRWLEREYRPRLWEVSSLTGHAFAHQGPFAYSHIKQCPHFDASYVELLPDANRGTHAFRSCAGIRLELGGNPFGVLLLYDTVPKAFSERDTMTLKIFGSIVSQLIAESLTAGFYQNANHFEHD